MRRATIEPLVEAGLSHIYLGIEAGDPRDLAHLNKLMSPEAHFAALEVIRELDLSFDFGFMLMNPWSSFDTVRGNLEFLQGFAGGGDSVAGFCRMLPYVGTEAENRLRAEGRLRSDDLRADYAFLDPRLDAFYAWFLELFAARNNEANGTLNLLRLLQFEAHLRFQDRAAEPLYKTVVRQLVALDNTNAIAILSAGLDYFEGSYPSETDDLRLAALAKRQQNHDTMLRRDLAGLLQSRPDSTQLLHATR